MKNIIVLLADIANGIFAIVFAAYITQTEVLWWYFLIGIPLAMCPDLDALPELFKRGKISASSAYPHDHRDTLHFPVLFLLMGGLLAWQFGFWGFVFLLATLFHFLNDLYGTGWGIPLFWPVTKKRYKLFGRRVNRLKSVLLADGDWSNISTQERRFRILVSWNKEELDSYIVQWGMDNWIKKTYFKLNWISCVEYSLFIFACVLVLVSLSVS